MLPTPDLVEALQQKFSSVWLAGGGSEIMVTCPYCHYRGMSKDTSGHLALNFTKNMAHCVKCDWGNRNLRDWLKKIKFTGQLPLPRIHEIGQIKPQRPKFPVLQSLGLPGRAERMEEHEANHFGGSLSEKNLLPQDWIEAKTYKCEFGPLGGYVVFPFYESGNLVYWQARAADPSIPDWKRKRNPEDVTLGKACWLYGYEPSLPRKAKIYLIEGTLDQISLKKHLREHRGEGHYGFAIQGTAFSFPDETQHPMNTQFGKLLSLDPEQVIILFDPDAKHKAEGLAQTLSVCGLDARAAQLEAKAGDPNEASDEQLSRAISGSQNGWASSMEQQLQSLSL